MSHRDAPSRPRRRRLVGTGALVAIVAIGVIGGSRPAAAIDTNPPNPGVVVTTGCLPEAPYASVVVSNVDGASTAHFDVTLSGSPSVTHFDVVPNTTQNVLFEFAEGQAAETVHTTADGAFVQDDIVGPFDCAQYQGQIVLTCDGATPTLTATYENKGITDSLVTLAAGGVSAVAPAGQKQEPLTVDVPDDQPFSATLSTKAEGTFATLDGTPDCVPLETTSTTVPDSTSTSTSVPASSSTVIPDSSTTSTVATSVISENRSVSQGPAPANVTLARTGIATWPLIGAGITLIGLGIALRRRAARLA